MESLSKARLETLKSIADGDKDFLSQLVTTFLLDSKNEMEKVEQAIISGDDAVIAAAAHKLKGSSSNIGAVRLAKLCEALAALTGKGDTQKQAEIVRGIHQEYSGLEKALKEAF